MIVIMVTILMMFIMSIIMMIMMNMIFTMVVMIEFLIMIATINMMVNARHRRFYHLAAMPSLVGIRFVRTE